MPLRFSIRLTSFQVCRDPESWEWCLAEQLTGAELYRGAERSKISAQVAAQLAFENWLQVDRRGEGFSNPNITTGKHSQKVRWRNKNPVSELMNVSNTAAETNRAEIIS